MNVIIAGKNNIAVYICDWLRTNYPEHQLYAVFNKNDQGVDTFQRSFKKYCNRHHINNISLKEAYELDNSIFLSLEYDQIVKPEMFSHKSIYNIHFSLLPKYKGMYTSAWPLLNGESESGVTLHCIEQGIDTGAIIDQIRFDIDENENAKKLYLKYIHNGIKLVKKNFESLLAGSFVAVKQSARDSTYYDRNSINYSTLKLNFNQTAENISRQVQAFTFRDFQLPQVNNYKVFGARILEKSSEKKPGNIVNDNEKSIIISTIDYDVEFYKDNLNVILEKCKTCDGDTLNNYVNTKDILFEKNHRGWNTICVAAYHGNIDLIYWLTSVGLDINDTNYNGTTVAMYFKDYIARTKEYSKFDKLLKLGADLDIQDYNGLTIYDYVLESNDIDLINFIMGFKK
ncbi:formyltransferase family protein [Enterobacter hormaechei]